MSPEDVTELRRRCAQALGDGTTARLICKFSIEVAQYEHSRSLATLRLHQKLRSIVSNQSDNNSSYTELTETIKNMVNEFNQWADGLVQLAYTASSLPRLTAELIRTKHITAMFTIRADNLIVQEGDSLDVVDNSQGHMIKIRNKEGKEGFVSVLSCIIPSADRTLANLVSRLHVELLGNWTECLRKVSTRLASLTKMLSQNVTSSSSYVDCRGIADVRALFSTLSQVQNSAKDRPVSVASVTGLTKAIQAFQVLHELWLSYRTKLEEVQQKTISVFDNLNDFRKVANNKALRCYETKFTVESTETREEITHTPRPPVGSSGFTTQCSIGEETWNQSVEAEQLTTSSQEEKHCFVIRAVRDPLTDVDISLDEAIERGIINQEAGQYVNPATGESKPIAMAMNEGLIQVARVTSTKSAPKTEAIGLITVRERVQLKHSRGYTLSRVLDSSTGERVDMDEASRRGLLDLSEGLYTLSTTGERMSIDAAVDAGYLTADYDVIGCDVSALSKTYAVSAVVNQKAKSKVSFAEAMSLHLIDRDTGDYVNNVTGEHVNVLEAINRGFIKAKVVEDPSSIKIDAVNHVVVERLAKVKSLVTGVGAISALMRASKRKK